jgi:hypothetical protein
MTSEPYDGQVKIRVPLLGTARESGFESETGAATSPAEAKSTPPETSKTGATLLTESDLKWIADPKRPGTYTAYAEGDPAKGPALGVLA